MATDANQLQNLREFLWAGDGELIIKGLLSTQQPKLDLRGLIALHGLTGSKIESVLH